MRYESAIEWDDLYNDLKDGRAILIIGPEFHTHEGVSVKELLYKELTKEEDSGVEHFYPDEGIFLFNSPRYKVKAQRTAAQFYKSLHVDNDFLQKIIDLPFRTIINTNPDKLLGQAFRKKGIQCQFDYYTGKPNKNAAELFDPTTDFPLVFNLFGTVDVFDSLILDFEDIFDHLKKLLNNTNVSDVFRTVLNETESYIFIGFRLEKWYTQLLFRYLNMKDSAFDDRKTNYTVRTVNLDNTSESFFRQQFNIKFYGAPIDFLDTLHKKYFEMAASEDHDKEEEGSSEENIKQYIANNEIQKALNLLTACLSTDENLLTELILVKSNFAQLKETELKKLDSAEALNIQRNKIKESILELAKNIPIQYE